MASSSFRENLIVRDPKKAEEIIKALKQPRDKTIKSVHHQNHQIMQMKYGLQNKKFLLSHIKIRAMSSF